MSQKHDAEIGALEAWWAGRCERLEEERDEARAIALRDALEAIDRDIEFASTIQVQIGLRIARNTIMRLAGIDERD